MVVEIINHIFFLLYIQAYSSFQQAFFMALRSCFFALFGKLQERSNVIGPIICYAVGLWLRHGLGISRATVTTAFKLFHVFLVKLLIVHFPCLKRFAAYSHFVKNVYLFQNIALNISLWLKTNLCGTIFPDFREFWSI